MLGKEIAAQYNKRPTELQPLDFGLSRSAKTEKLSQQYCRFVIPG